MEREMEEQQLRLEAARAIIWQLDKAISERDKLFDMVRAHLDPGKGNEAVQADAEMMASLVTPEQAEVLTTVMETLKREVQARLMLTEVLADMWRRLSPDDGLPVPTYEDEWPDSIEPAKKVVL